jgi:hypothetical protein
MGDSASALVGGIGDLLSSGAGAIGSGAEAVGSALAPITGAAAPALGGVGGEALGDAFVAGAGPLNILASSPAAEFAPSVAGDLVPLAPGGSALASGLSTEPLFASSAPAAYTGAGVSPFNIGGTSAVGLGPAPGSLDALATGVPAGTSPIPAGASSVAAPAGGIPAANAAPAATATPSAPAGAAPVDLSSTATSGASGAAPGAAAPAAAAGSPSLLSTIGTDLKAALPFASAGALGYSVYSQYQNNKQIPAIGTSAAQTEAAATSLAGQGQAANAAAQPLIASGQSYINAAQSGTLMPADQANLNAAVQSATAQTVSSFAARGEDVSKNASGAYNNTQLQQAIQTINNQAQVTQDQILQGYASTGTSIVNTANSLLSTGASDTAVSGQLANSVSQLSTQLSAQTGQAIANFAAALAGRLGGGITIKLPQGTTAQ